MLPSSFPFNCTHRSQYEDLSKMKIQQDVRILDGANGRVETLCPVCSSKDGFVFWEAMELPIFCNVLCASRDEARQMPRGDIRLAFCHRCGLISNPAFEPERLAYSADYENSLHFSPRFQAYADELAARLVERHALQNKVILEIACGKGDFLRSLCRLGNNRGIGFDPSYEPAESDDDTIEHVTFIQDYYSERYADCPADLICCRHSLEHMADPLAFLRSLRRSIGDRTDTIVFFEVPNALYTLRELGIWDLIYEHCTYFVPQALSYLFRVSGFDVLDATEAFDGQFLCLEAKPNAGIAETPQLDGVDIEQTASAVRSFAGRYQKKMETWRRRLDEIHRAGQRVVVWGAGSKGVTFLNVLRTEDLIQYVVDINPRKHGKYIAGTGQRIVGPEFMKEYRPDVVILMNPIYRREVRHSLAQLDVRAKLVIA